MSAPSAPLDYARSKKQAHLAELFAFLKIPSVSTQAARTDDVRRAADWLSDNLTHAGLENVRLYETMGHPIVYADWLHADGAPTVLFYGHYDVQPADDIEKWKSPPFEPEVRKESVYGRGVSDDKGQVMILLKAVESYLQTGNALPVNVKFLIEGEEESGGKGLAAFLPEHRDLLTADIAFVSDTSMVDWDCPTIVYGLRGIYAVNLDITSAKRDLHSGTYGGGINNPINAATQLISKLQDADGHVLIPGFYDDVLPLSQPERELLNSAPFNEADFLGRIDAPAAWGEPDYTLVERIGARPTLDINGIVGGYTGIGGKTIIPSTVHVKISMRLVPNQDPVKIHAAMLDYLQEIVPPTVTVSVSDPSMAVASVVSIDDPAIGAAAEACDAVFGRKAVFKREGGSIPIVGQFKRDLGIETVLLGFGLPHDRIHAPNERFYLPNFYRGIETVIHFLANYGNGSSGL